MSRYVYIAIFATAILGFAFFFANRSTEIASPTSVSHTRASESSAEQNQAFLPSEQVESTKATSVKLIGSIYEQELGFRQQAIEAVETRAEYYEPGSLLRWEPVYINPKEIFPAGYLDDSAMPTRFDLNPFPDVQIIADVTSFDVFKESQTALWQGNIRNSTDGTVAITFAGGEENPGLMLRIQNPPQYIKIVETTVPNAYIAVEHNGVSSAEFEPQPIATEE